MTTKNVNCNELKWKFMEIIQQSRIRALAFTFGLCTLVIEWNISLFTNCAKMQTRKIEKQPKYGEFPTTGTSQIGWSYIQIMHHSWIKHSYITYFIFIDVYFHYIFPIYSTLQRRIRITFWLGTFSIAYCERSWAISISESQCVFLRILVDIFYSYFVFVLYE